MCTHIIIYTFIYTISLFPFVAVATIIQPTGASSSLEYDSKYLVIIQVSWNVTVNSYKNLTSSV